MKYNNIDIGEPCENIVQICLNKRCLSIDAAIILKFYRELGWKTKGGKPIKTVDDMVTDFMTEYTDKPRCQHKKRKFKKYKSYPGDKNMPYHEQLCDKRWHEFRLYVIRLKNNSCELCGSSDRLNVHHKEYVKGKMAWDYKMKEVMLLCRECHKKMHGIDLDEQMDVAILNDKY